MRNPSLPNLSTVSAGESVPDFLDIDYVNIEAGTAPIFLPHELAIESHVSCNPFGIDVVYGIHRDSGEVHDCSP